MRYAIISDIHANLEALTATLATLDARGVDRIVCLGDIVGYFAHPNECIDLLIERRALCIGGNHDRVAIVDAEPADFSPTAAHAIFWTREKLSASSRQFLATLQPFAVVSDHLLAVHGSLSPSPNDDRRITGPADAGASFQVMGQLYPSASLCFFGHTHQPVAYQWRDGIIVRPQFPSISLSDTGRYLINPGSVGLPRDADPRASCLIYDDQTHRVELLRVVFDRAAARRHAARQGLQPPDSDNRAGPLVRIGRRIVRPLRRQKSPDRPLNIMHVTWSLVAGGSEIYAWTIASHLDPHRFQSAMCALDAGGSLESEIAQAGVPFSILNRPAGIHLSLMWRLFRLFRQHKVDVVHTHHFNQLFYSLPAARLLGARLIHTEHSVECYRRRRLRVALRFMSIFCHQVNAISADGHAVLRDRVGISSRKLRIIPAGVDSALFDYSRSDARRELDLAEDDRVVLILARLFAEKNHLLLLKAFAQVAEKIPNARLLIVGEGVERPTIATAILQLKLQSRARMLGVRRDVPRILAAADLLVLCSDREGLPIAILEAMAAQRPIVATAVGDIPRLLQDGQAGRLVPPGDVRALADAISELLADPVSRQAMGQAGRRRVQQQFGVASLITRHELLYNPQARLAT